MDKVKVIRKLRDDSITVEIMPRWLAELVVAEVPYAEPLTASLRIVPIEYETQPSPDIWQTVEGIALAMYCADDWQTGAVQ